MDPKILFFLVFLLIWYIVFSGLNKLIVKFLSYDIDKRYLHFRTVIAGTLFAIITANSNVYYYAVILADNFLQSWYVSLFLEKIMPNRAYELAYLIVCNLLLNLIYVVAFIIVLAITMIIFKGKNQFIEYEYCIGSDKFLHAPWYIVNKFYNNETGKAELTEKGFSMGIWVKGMKRVFAIIWIVELAVLYFSIFWGSMEWNGLVLSVSKSVYLLPMLVFFLLEQIQFFLEGPETVEVGTFGTVDIKENLVGDMDFLMYRYREIFSDDGFLLYSERGTGRGLDHEGLESNDLGNQQLNDCDEPGVLAAITNQLRESGILQNANYQNAIASILNGDSISVRDNACGEFAIYICAYLNYYLSRGYSAVILCADKTELAELKKEYKSIKEKLKGIDSVWQIYEINELISKEPAGVLICTYEEFIATNFRKQHEKLSSDIICAVIPNSSQLMSHDNIHIEKVFSRLRSFSNLGRYIFLSEEDNESLRAKIRRFIPEGVNLSSYSNDMRQAKTSIMIWKEESAYKPQSVLKIGNTGAPFLGTAFPLALVAVKYDLPKVNIISDENRGDNYFFGSARQSNKREVMAYLEKELRLEPVIRYSLTEAMEPSDLKMIIVYDTDYNFFNALWRWFKYAGNNGTIVHVVSPFYMMREYFAANFKRRSLLYSNNEYNALLPYDVVLKHTLLASVLALLTDDGLTEEEIMSISNKYEWDYTDVTALLQDAVLTVRDNREFHNVYEHFKFEEEKFFDEKKSGFTYRIRIKLTDENMIEQQKSQISLARMSYRSNEYHELPVLCGNLWNYYLPKQVVVFEKNFYTVSSIDEKNGIVHTIPTNPALIPDYYTISDYYISKWEELDNCVDTPVIDYNIYEADVKKRFYGYIATNNGNRFSKENSLSLNRINNNDGRYPTIELKHVPVLEVKILRSCFGIASGEDPDKAIMLLCVILNGMFKTMFPKTYQNIAAVPDMPIDIEMIERILKNAFDYPVDEIIRASIPRINYSDIGKDDRFVRFFVIEFSCIEYGMVRSFYDKKEDILNKAYDYLDWYLASNGVEAADGMTNIIKGSYLHFGKETIPDLFAPDALHSVLRDILSITEPETVIVPEVEEAIPYDDSTKSVCSFCNREIIFAWQLGDGRFMCAHCHDHQKTQKGEIKELFLETKQMLESHYHIAFRKDINVRFQSADAIMKAAGRYDKSRIVGFYKHDNRQLWIESKGPSVAMESTIIHELTHAWQFDNLPLDDLAKKFKRELREKRILLLLEGHAVYIELEVMREKGEAGYAARLEREYTSKADVYSLGYQLISDSFRDMRILGSNVNSFAKMQKLVDAIIKGEDCVVWPEGYRE